MSATSLDLDTLWHQSLTELLESVISPPRREWLKATRPVGFSDETIILASPNQFARRWLEEQHHEAIQRALSTAAGRPLAVVLTVQTNPEPLDASIDLLDEPAATPPHDSDLTAPVGSAGAMRALDPASAPPEPAHEGWPPSTGAFTDQRPLHAPGRPAGPTVDLPPPRPPQGDDVGSVTQLSAKYTFDNFIAGPSNRLSHAAAVAVAEAPAKSYNPLFIYGDSGLGKTHLLHAVGNYVRDLYPRLTVRYVTTEQFTNEFINSIRNVDRTVSSYTRSTQFQRTYRETDVLLIDDIQFLERAERTQEEFFHTFNALHNAEKQIVISSDRRPELLGQLEERLRTRFAWGLLADVHPPDLEMRIAILRKKCESDRLHVGPDVLEFIADKVKSNIRELEGALTRVWAHASLEHAPVDLARAEAALKDVFPDGREQDVSVQLIKGQVAAYFSLTVEDLCSPSRSRQLVTARQIAMYLTRELTGLSLPRIGQEFGGRDHTTVMHANSKIARLMQERRPIYDQVQELTNRIKTQARRA